MQAAQNQTLPITDARVITNASPPDRHSHPKVPLVLALGLAAGLGAGVGVGIVRELLNRTIRNKRQLEKAPAFPASGLLPTIKTGAVRTKADAQFGPREIVPKRSELTFVCRAPFSQFAEGIRAIKLAVDLSLTRSSGVVVGVVSSLPGEGKSTVSSNLAFLMAQAGSRVLLIDCDMRNPSLTSGLTPRAETGLRQILSQAPTELERLIWRHEATGLHFLPANLKEAPDHTSSLLSSPAMDQLLKAARAHYDYVVLDFAPMLPVVDVRAAAHLVDGFVLVGAWAQTPMDALTEAVSLLFRRPHPPSGIDPQQGRHEADAPVRRLRRQVLLAVFQPVGRHGRPFPSIRKGPYQRSPRVRSRAASRPDSTASAGHRRLAAGSQKGCCVLMKVVILAGGYGTRISEETTVLPKPLVEIGGKPILWHIMKIYAAYGLTEFVVCCGYKGNLIKRYFNDFFVQNSDITIDLSNNELRFFGAPSSPGR